MNQRIARWNQNGLLRRLSLVVLTLGLAAAGLWTLPYVWPFAAAFLFSRMLEPFVRFIVSKGLLRLPKSKRRPIAAALGMLLLFGLAGAGVSFLISWLLREAGGFIRSLPQLVDWVNAQAVPALLSLYRRFSILLPDYLPKLVEDTVSTLSQNAVRWAGTLSVRLTSGAWNTAASLPHALLGTVLTIMSTYYLTADRARIAAFFHRTFPPETMKRSRLIRVRFFGALMGQLRSQLMISMVVMFFLMIALGLSGVTYGALIGLLIGLADGLPLFGAGLFLIPWCLVSFLMGQTQLGILLACLYVGTIVIRQILEPRLVGKQLGLYPLAAMMAMYIGYRALGVLGLLAGPVLLNLIKAVLDADEAATADPS